MLGMPAPTAYDLRFRLLGIPVRVHPFFWVAMWFISGAERDLVTALIFMACAFVSILAHEYGHGLMSRYFGEEPRSVVLYAMGGLCETTMEQHSLWQRAAVLSAGPGAGFLLCILVMAFGVGVLGVLPRTSLALVGIGSFTPSQPLEPLMRLISSPHRCYAYYVLIRINLWWGLLNLLPIWPLDGGRLAEVFLTMYNRRQGRRWAHVIALVTAGILAVWRLQSKDHFMAIWFGYFALVNFQVLQTIHETARYGIHEDEGDWWKR